MSDETTSTPPPMGEHYGHVTKPCDKCSEETKRLAYLAGGAGFLLGLGLIGLIVKVRARG